MVRVAKIMVVLGLLVLCESAWGFSGSGSGIESDPYVITNVEKLQEMQDDLGAWYVLANDINVSDTQTWNGGMGFEPVGTSTNGFRGTLDGQRHTIMGLHINRPSMTDVGLFGFIRENAEVKNVVLFDVNVTGYMNTGALVGLNIGGRVFRCSSSGTVHGTKTGQSRIGGLVGISSDLGSYVSQCYSTADVSGGSGGQQIGGLAGYNGHGSVTTDSYAMGTVTGDWKVGGLVGDNTVGAEGTLIARCYSVGKVNGSGGGLVGFNWQNGITKDSYWDIQTSGKISSRGGSGKTTAQMMQQATFANWDFSDIWHIEENETYPVLIWELSGYEWAIIRIEQAIAKKLEALETIDAALEKEWAAYDALDELLASGDYEGLSKRDIVKAKQGIHSAIQRQEQAADALERSIEKLEDSLSVLGYEVEPNGSNN